MVDLRGAFFGGNRHIFDEVVDFGIQAELGSCVNQPFANAAFNFGNEQFQNLKSGNQKNEPPEPLCEIQEHIEIDVFGAHNRILSGFSNVWKTFFMLLKRGGARFQILEIQTGNLTDRLRWSGMKTDPILIALGKNVSDLRKKSLSQERLVNCNVD